jgi:lia operon protein LiaF
MIGNIYLNVPSDIGMSVQMSLLCGKMNLLKDSKTAFNVTQKYQSVDYKNASRKIKIVVSLLVGDIEVKHR